jgi:hypothetical protein
MLLERLKPNERRGSKPRCHLDAGLTWALSRDWNYQMSNRLAWALKLTDLGVPVVLVYLGFLCANEMSDHGKPLFDASDWQNVVKRHSQVLFPEAVWDQRWICRGQPLIPLIRSLYLPLDELVRR